MCVLKCVQRLSFASSFTKRKKDVHYMFQTNSVVTQTEELCRRSLGYSEFLRENRCGRAFSRPFPGPEVMLVNIHVLQKISMCVISSPISLQSHDLTRRIFLASSVISYLSVSPRVSNSFSCEHVWEISPTLAKDHQEWLSYRSNSGFYICSLILVYG